MEECLDRLSDLPDSLLISIMSLLKARDVVQTCVLSKRWCYIWASVPCLHFDFDEFGENQEKFNQFVSSFLNLRNETSNVHTFKLSCVSWEYIAQPDFIGKWILYACKHKVKNLEVDLSGNYNWSIPRSLFSCDSVEIVHLNGLVVIEADGVWLPKLRNLSLCSVRMIGDFMQKILSGCPSLETLHMKYLTLDINRILFQNVKNLTLEHCYFCYSLSEPTFYISAPCVKYLKLVRNKMLRLRSALMKNKKNGLDFNLLSAITGVETLELYNFYLEEMLDHELQKGSTFNNLKHLVLRVPHVCCYFCKLSSFLRRCPNLKTLCFVPPIYPLLEQGPIKKDDFENTEEIEVCACRRLKVGPSKEDNSENTQPVEVCDCQCLKVLKIVVHPSYPRCCVHFLENNFMELNKELDGIQIILSRTRMS